MKLFSQIELSELTGKERLTIRKRLKDVPFTPGPSNAKLYDPQTALEAIYKVGALAALSQAREEEIRLNMEIKRKERIPIGDVEEILEQALGNMAGMLKGWAGKVLSNDNLKDLLAEFRTIGASLK